MAELDTPCSEVRPRKGVILVQFSPSFLPALLSPEEQPAVTGALDQLNNQTLSWTVGVAHLEQGGA